MDCPIEGCTILIVENELLLAMTLAKIVGSCGGSVAGPVACATRAGALLDAGGIDAALIDFNLVDHTSESLALALAARDVPFAFVTGHSRALLPESMHAFPILEKPCSFDQVRRLLQTLCAARQRDA